MNKTPLILFLFLVLLAAIFFPKENNQRYCMGMETLRLQSEKTCFGIPYGSRVASNENSLPENKETSEIEIRALLDESNYCEVKDDCTVASYGCPFGCFNLVNKNVDLSAIEQQIEAYSSSENMRCIYDCDRNPYPEEIACVSNKCVDLRYINE